MWKRSFVSSLYIYSWILVILSQTNGMPSSSASIIFNEDSVIVDPGEKLSLDCGVDGIYRSCFWEKSGEESSIQVLDVHEGRLQGFSKPQNTKGNECGIVINHVNDREHGKWTCKVFVVGKTIFGTKNIVVTVKPQPPILDINENPLVLEENEQKQIVCTVTAARPAAGVRWFIGTEDVTSRSTSENIPTDDKGTYRSVSTLNYKFHYTDDRKGLRCSITHATLQEPESSEVPLDVRYAPYPISSTMIYGIPMTPEYEIKYNFTANPVPPDMRWLINDLEIPVPGENELYLTNVRKLMDNIYMATLRIKNFNEEDLGVTYRLYAKNSIGERTFDITLSTSPAPPDSIGGGTLAAIVVIIIFILILLFIIGVMRYRQMYCFAMRAESKAYIQDPERHHVHNHGHHHRSHHHHHHNQDYPNYKINEAIRGSMDQLNGRMMSPSTDALNGNGNGSGTNGLTTTTTANIEQHNKQDFNNIESVGYPTSQINYFPENSTAQHEKKNTDV